MTQLECTSNVWQEKVAFGLHIIQAHVKWNRSRQVCNKTVAISTVLHPPNHVMNANIPFPSIHEPQALNPTHETPNSNFESGPALCVALACIR